MNYILSWDRSILRYVNHRLKCRFLDLSMPYVTHLGGAKFSILLALMLVWTQLGSASALGKHAVYALTASHIVVQIAKKLVTRPRPFLTLLDTNVIDALLLKDYSFPSGHTTASFSLAMTLSLYVPILSPLFISIALLVGISRIYLGLHYPTDVLIGAAIGCISAIVAYLC